MCAAKMCNNTAVQMCNLLQVCLKLFSKVNYNRLTDRPVDSRHVTQLCA